MIAQRLNGLLNLHIAVSVLFATSVFQVYSDLFDFLPVKDLQADAVLMPYLLSVAAGMVLAGRYVSRIGTKFHRIKWVDAADLSTKQTLCVALVIFALMFAMKDRAISRLFLGTFLCWLWLVLMFVNQGLPRLLTRMVFRKKHKVPTLFVGTSGRAQRLNDWLAQKEALGIQPVGFITPTDETGDAENAVPLLGALADIRRVIEEEGVTQVVVLDMPALKVERRFIVEICQDCGCRLLIHSDLSDQLQMPLVPVVEEGSTFFSLQEEPLEDPLNRVLKRTFDIVLSLPVVLLVLPAMCMWVWVMQRTQAPGPLFFIQRRKGDSRGDFDMLKFRSMYAAPRSVELEAKQARQNDDRIYPFGRFLRKTSLDEFPQFVNVLMGNMSIVGPRPHMPVHDEEFSRHFRGYRTRQFAKPGITGLAQTRGFRGEISEPALLEKRIANDLYYIANWSIWMDIQITFKTAWQLVFPPKTAY
jgi:exopolysaccharide biosynthesis polyprenyl glycosylphosphotransferase